MLCSAPGLLLLDITSTPLQSVNAIPTYTPNPILADGKASNTTVSARDDRGGPFQVLADGTQDLAALLVGSR